MQLDFAFFAKAAEVTADGLLSVLGGGIQGLTTREFPLRPRTLALALRLRFPSEASGFRSVLTVTGVGPDGIETAFRADVPFGPLRGAAEGRTIYVTAVVQPSGLSFPTPGRYVFPLAVGVVPIGEVELYVESSDPQA